MNIAFSEIPNSCSWNKIELVNKGWSNDKKYYIETQNGTRLLLRVSDITQYERRKKEYDIMNQLDELDILISRPIDFGTCNKDQDVYTLLTWINGKDAETVLPSLTDMEKYNLGFETGKILRKIHQIPAPEGQLSWSERFNKKIDRNIRNYESCEIKFQGSDNIIKYINQNRYLLEERKQSLQHGDYHVGNMIVTEHSKIGIIDFNRVDFGDPWEEFNRITWCADISNLFASGRINGYFDNDVPDTFFRLMALYIGSNQLSSIPWAIPFGQTEINVMINQAQNVLKWYDNFQTYIPKWYVKNYAKNHS
ncbi:phosphotransferase family protein [Vallitalea longa]|uniref:Phosphotransferase family protein n=1 Tax=Vallitalea longa TaxID=2936439 RepID=A0A9W6DFE7_9FIRM|nr:phosphotransferase family protein [Vallitalea longa]GKX31141.1 phosphotransferase family protein [Vallitalea longa]